MLFDHFDAVAEDRIATFLTTHFGSEKFRSDMEQVKYYALTYDLIPKSEEVCPIIIGGTNGKGEVAISLYENLKSHQLDVACWMSPHILSIRERFLGKAGSISYSELEKMLHKHLDQMHQLSIQLSYYEFLFVIFLDWVKQSGINILVLEVGLGGRLDAVNIVDAKLCALTSIGRDHIGILGNSYKKILIEKLAITRPHCKLYTNLSLQYLKDYVSTYVTERGIFWSNGEAKDNYSMQNQWLAQKLFLEVCPFGDWEEHFLSRQWEFKGVTFSGTHNLAGARNFVHLLDGQGYNHYYDLTLCAFSLRPFKEVKQMLCLLKGRKDLFGEVVVCNFDHPKAMSYAENFNDEGKLINDPVELLNNNLSKKILVLGSYYFVASIMRNLLQSTESRGHC